MGLEQLAPESDILYIRYSLRTYFMKNHEQFERSIKRSLNSMDAKITYLHDGMKGLADAFKEFQDEMTDYLSFSAENYADHEKRITALEKKAK